MQYNSEEEQIIFYSLENLVLLRVPAISEQGDQDVSCDFLSRQSDSHLVPPAFRSKIVTEYQLEKRHSETRLIKLTNKLITNNK